MKPMSDKPKPKPQATQPKPAEEAVDKRPYWHFPREDFTCRADNQEQAQERLAEHISGLGDRPEPKENKQEQEKE